MLGGLLVANGLGFTALDRWFDVEPGFVNLLGGLGLIVTADRPSGGHRGWAAARFVERRGSRSAAGAVRPVRWRSPRWPTTGRST